MIQVDNFVRLKPYASERSYWRFKFKYTHLGALDANTYIVIQSSMSSMSIFTFSPWHKRMYIIRFQTHKYTKYGLWTWWSPYKLCIWLYIEALRFGLQPLSPKKVWIWQLTRPMFVPLFPSYVFSIRIVLVNINHNLINNFHIYVAYLVVPIIWGTKAGSMKNGWRIGINLSIFETV